MHLRHHLAMKSTITTAAEDGLDVGAGDAAWEPGLTSCSPCHAAEQASIAEATKNAKSATSRCIQHSDSRSCDWMALSNSASVVTCKEAVPLIIPSLDAVVLLQACVLHDRRDALRRRPFQHQRLPDGTTLQHATGHHLTAHHWKCCVART